jgi:hypothetical protein
MRCVAPTRWGLASDTKLTHWAEFSCRKRSATFVPAYWERRSDEMGRPGSDGQRGPTITKPSIGVGDVIGGPA